MTKELVFLLFLLSNVYSIDTSCISSAHFNGHSRTETTSCLKDNTGVMSLSVFYQVTIEGAGNATMNAVLNYKGKSLYKSRIPMIVSSVHGQVVSIGDGNALNPCKYPSLRNVDSSLLSNELNLSQYEVTETAALSYVVYNRLYDAKLVLGEPKTAVTPNFPTVAEYYLFNIEHSKNENDMYNITVKLENNGPLHIEPFASISLAGAGYCVNNHDAVRSEGIDWDDEKIVTVTFLGRCGDWNIGLHTFPTGANYTITVTKEYVGQGICDEYGFCEIEEEDKEPEGWKFPWQ